MKRIANTAYQRVGGSQAWLMETSRLQAMLTAPGLFEAFFEIDEDEDDFVDTGLPVRTVADGVVVVKAKGVMMKDPGIFERIFLHAIDTDAIGETISALAEKDDVKKIILDIDSPGGATPGVRQAAQAIYTARDKVVAYTSGGMQSAGYWVGSAASQVYASQDARMGSIGVKWKHHDFSAGNEQKGLKITEIASGKWKTLGSSDLPLSEEDQAHIQGYVDEIAQGFFDAVATYRGLSAETVKGFEADTFSATKALGNGLIDGVMSFDELVGKVIEDTKQTDIDGKDTAMKKEEIYTMFPGVLPATVDSIITLAAEGNPESAEEDGGMPKDKESCEKKGYYWYKDACHKEEEKKDEPDAADDSMPTDKESCEKKGYYWYKDTCHKEEKEKENDAKTDALGREVDQLRAAMGQMNSAMVAQVWAGVFADTALSPGRQTDLKALIMPGTYTTGGYLDVAKFGAAVKAKVAEYEAELGGDQVTGFDGQGFAKGSGSPSAETDAEYVERVMGGGN